MGGVVDKKETCKWTVALEAMDKALEQEASRPAAQDEGQAAEEEAPAAADSEGPAAESPERRAQGSSSAALVMAFRSPSEAPAGA